MTISESLDDYLFVARKFIIEHPLGDKVSLVVGYGSFFLKNDDHSSDIDIMVIVDEDVYFKQEVVLLSRRYEFVFISSAGLYKMLGEGNDFFVHALYSCKYIYGDEKLFFKINKMVGFVYSKGPAYFKRKAVLFSLSRLKNIYHDINASSELESIYLVGVFLVALEEVYSFKFNVWKRGAKRTLSFLIEVDEVLEQDLKCILSSSVDINERKKVIGSLYDRALKGIEPYAQSSTILYYR